MRVWISRDGGAYNGCVEMWNDKPTATKLGDFMKSNNHGKGLDFFENLKPGECIEFKLVRVPNPKRGKK